jgi:dolichyl-phosphate-mannose--protein O-mannosyl transferase
VGAYVLVVLIMFWYFYPLLAGQIISYQDWWSHIWYRVGNGWV